MGAWIEIYHMQTIAITSQGRTPRWVRGLKYIDTPKEECLKSRTPRWVRGLKFIRGGKGGAVKGSHPTMGAWIEILNPFIVRQQRATSHPTMGAWIEIQAVCHWWTNQKVAPHDGCVDWNFLKCVIFVRCSSVAPHDGCVDWNLVSRKVTLSAITVAPHDGCVDWN